MQRWIKWHDAGKQLSRSRRDTENLQVRSTMKLAEIIRAQKTGVLYSDWHTGRVPNASFPLLKKGVLPAGIDWAWRLVQFDALERHFRILIRLNESKEYFSSILAMEDPRGLVVICHHELHTSHRDWHCHLVSRDVSAIYPGVLRDKDQMRIWPSAFSGPCSIAFTVDRNSAVSVAATRFRLPQDGVQGILL